MWVSERGTWWTYDDGIRARYTTFYRRNKDHRDNIRPSVDCSEITVFGMMIRGKAQLRTTSWKAKQKSEHNDFGDQVVSIAIHPGSLARHWIFDHEKPCLPVSTAG
ncbi:hypothetical protein BDR03DRAFT_538468 [Suillus americanus]|nr:hypothetical protein BDR03DRAFT_538468 [Suillus americanus]